jgi:hypothetical protein
LLIAKEDADAPAITERIRAAAGDSGLEVLETQISGGAVNFLQ